MKKAFLLLSALALSAAAQQSSDSVTLRSIYDHFLTSSSCYEDLRVLTNEIGGRLSGSTQAAKAVEWARKAMYAAGADTVILQPCMVPHWERGKKEVCAVISNGKSVPLKCTALGSSVGTGEKGVRAQVVEVGSYEELDKLGVNGVRGKIVFFNVFFDQRLISTGNAYGSAVRFRGRGASHAAKYGAVAMVIRSMTSVADDEPHTGNMIYDTTISAARIPAVALSYIAADKLHHELSLHKNVQISLYTFCRTLPDAPSFNVIGQINGSEKNAGYIIAGGHLDSWDNGQGAHDDGAGIVQSIGVLGMYRKLNIRPRHNIRAVAFMNEENGLAGGITYAKLAHKNGERHIAALESDAGGFVPRGFGVDTARGLYRQVISWKSLFEPYQVHWIGEGGGGADISGLAKLGVPCIGFEPDMQRYFDIHHSAQDTFDKINKRELNLGGAAIASLLYLLDRYRD